MFKSLKRLQLKRKGLSCGRRRRKQSSNEFVERIRENGLVKVLILTLFFAGAVGLILHARSGDGVAQLDDTGRAVALAAILFTVAIGQLFFNDGITFRRNSRVLLIFSVVLSHLALVYGIGEMSRANGLAEPGRNYSFLLLPYAFGPALCTVLLGRHYGIYAAVFATLFGALLVPAGSGMAFAMSSMISGFVGVYLTDQIRKRSRFVRAGFYLGLTTVLLAFVFGHIGPEWGELGQTNWQVIGMQCVVGLGVGIATMMVVAGVLPVIESCFRITTGISWVEMADLNHPLLRRLTLEAPGTYQHSVMVANLSKAAAEAIEANATMCQVCSYFHDIGKLVKPDYFIENIGDNDNPHDELTPTMSALVIISHVKDGVDIALKNKLTNEIIHVIREHHGTSLAYYFYRKALDHQESVRKEVEEGNANEEDIPEVQKEGFRYPGPRPQSRESGIISLADAIESASRTLQKPTPRKVKQTIDEIINARILDGQLDECSLTLEEINLIRESFYTTLKSIMHNRISYPKPDTDTGEKKKRAKKKKSGETGGNGENGKAKKKGNGVRSGALLP
jgi:putative nucleotidyltransferase with HDIG domain